jgi:hypothetical protein
MPGLVMVHEHGYDCRRQASRRRRPDPSTTIADIRTVETVFKAGVGSNPVKLIDSVQGHLGLW